jgi:hypothetical protein
MPENDKYRILSLSAYQPDSITDYRTAQIAAPEDFDYDEYQRRMDMIKRGQEIQNLGLYEQAGIENTGLPYYQVGKRDTELTPEEFASFAEREGYDPEDYYTSLEWMSKNVAPLTKNLNDFQIGLAGAKEGLSTPLRQQLLGPQHASTRYGSFEWSPEKVDIDRTGRRTFEMQFPVPGRPGMFDYRQSGQIAYDAYKKAFDEGRITIPWEQGVAEQRGAVAGDPERYDIEAAEEVQGATTVDEMTAPKQQWADKVLMDQSPFAYGGKIRIKPENRGKFTAKANAAGMGVQEFASKVLSAKEGTYSPATRKQANFARNASKWNAYGGELTAIPTNYYQTPTGTLATNYGEAPELDMSYYADDYGNTDENKMSGSDALGYGAMAANIASSALPEQQRTDLTEEQRKTMSQYEAGKDAVVSAMGAIPGWGQAVQGFAAIGKGAKKAGEQMGGPAGDALSYIADPMAGKMEVVSDPRKTAGDKAMGLASNLALGWAGAGDDFYGLYKDKGKDIPMPTDTTQFNYGAYGGNLYANGGPMNENPGRIRDFILGMKLRGVSKPYLGKEAFTALSSIGDYGYQGDPAVLTSMLRGKKDKVYKKGSKHNVGKAFDVSAKEDSKGFIDWVNTDQGKKWMSDFGVKYLDETSAAKRKKVGSKGTAPHHHFEFKKKYKELSPDINPEKLSQIESEFDAYKEKRKYVDMSKYPGFQTQELPPVMITPRRTPPAPEMYIPESESTGIVPNIQMAYGGDMDYYGDPLKQMPMMAPQPLPVNTPGVQSHVNYDPEYLQGYMERVYNPQRNAGRSTRTNLTTGERKFINPLGDMFTKTRKIEAEGGRYSSGFAYGGKMDKMYQAGGDLTEYNGNRHETGGIPLGDTNNEVEDGEIRWDTPDGESYIFSDRIPYINSKKK